PGEVRAPAEPDGVVHVQEAAPAHEALDGLAAGDQLAVEPGDVVAPRGDGMDDPRRRAQAGQLQRAARILADPGTVLDGLDAELAQRRQELADPEAAGRIVAARGDGGDADHAAPVSRPGDELGPHLSRA